MSNLYRNFLNGKMDLDTEARLLAEGVYRYGKNIYVVNSESSDVGSIQKSFSNKQLTNIDFGNDPKCLLGLNDEYEKKIYWFIVSANGCYLIEWDDVNQAYSIVLEDTRPIGSRVLDLKPTNLITGIFKIINDDPNKNLLCWTDDNMEPCCINISRAKTYGANNFDKEDIYLIKKPPVNAPQVIPINISGVANNKMERYFSFCYRFKYLDGEFSALSSYSNYDFNPKAFDLNFYTLDNKGMINAFNAAKISFETGDKRVTDIQLVFKESNSNALFLIENFNKQNLGWGDNQTKTYIFSNNKSYTSLPEDELYRNCDYVPLKAKALTFIGNRAVFGNYVEGRNIVDANGRKIVPDYSVSVISEPLDFGNELKTDIVSSNTIEVTNPESFPLTEGFKLIFYFNLQLNGSASYENSFYFILPQDYNSLNEVFDSADFESFLTIIDADIKNNFQYDVPDGWNVSVQPSIVYSVVGEIPTFTITPVTFIDTTDGDTPHVLNFTIVNNSYVSIVSSSNSTSCKTNQDYEVGLVYEDDFGRKTTVLTSIYNTIHISQLFSIFKNKLRITLNSPAPFWAKRLRVCVKTKPLLYQTIYVNRFYNENFYVWAKLEAENKDKVKVGDILIVKKGPDPLIDPIEVKVLEIKEQVKDFIPDNNDENGNEIIEEAGLYMKIRPEGFSMDFDNYSVNSGEANASSDNRPVTYLDLFTDLAGPTELSIAQGSSISLYLDSTFKYDSGWRHNIYDVIHYAQRNYTTIEEWFNENIIGQNLFITNSAGVVRNYGPQLSLVRGSVNTSLGNPIFSADPAGKLFLKVIGLETGGSRNRKGRVYAKIVVRSSTGFYVFETKPKQADSKLFYETPQSFEINNGNHLGNVQYQDLNTFTPAIIDVDFFNCYAQGNGVESYKVRDGFNTNYLNVDLRPSLSMIEEYKQIRRKSSIIHGEKFIEGTNINGLNEFNLSRNISKDLDKQYGSIQKLHARDNDILVLQEEKASKILFEKRAVTEADGSESLVTSDIILGEQRTYLGENGIGTAPESFAENDYQIYFANPRKGIIQRLSIDGVEPIINGLRDWFRDTFISRPNSKKIGGFDPYHQQYFISIGSEPTRYYNVGCGAVVNKFNQTEQFVYNFNLNETLGDFVLQYNISQGNATITVEFDGDIYPESNVNGEGTITVSRDNINASQAIVTITPVEGPISYSILNLCPVSIPLTIVSVVLGGSEDLGKTITTRYKWSDSSFYPDLVLFSENYVSRFLIETGTEGQGKFPARGSIVRMETLKELTDTAEFSLDQCNRIGYLISETSYTEDDIETIKSLAVWLSISQFENIFFGNFLFSKTTDEEKLYLIWDYEDKKPVLFDDFVFVLTGRTITVNVLANDIVGDDFEVSIVDGPSHGTATLNENNTITYENDGSFNTEDTITYKVTQNGCSAFATLNFSIYTDIETPELFYFAAAKSMASTWVCGSAPVGPRNIYVNVAPYSSSDWFSLITQIWFDSAGTIPASPGWYSDMYLSSDSTLYYYLYWNGSAVTDVGTCSSPI